MLESLKKEAKRWVKALRANEAPARARFVRVHPNPPAAPTLRDVQLALARERGFAGWAELKAEVEAQPPRDAARAKRVQWFLENACPDHHVRGRSSHARSESTAMRLLARDPDIAHDSFCTEVVCGNRSEVERVLARRPLAASALCDTRDPRREEAAGDDWLKDLGPKGWQPLLYLCSTRLSLPSVAENSIAIARMLLDHGADPNIFFMAGFSKYTPLVAAIGEGEENRPPHPRRNELARLLLDRGAVPNDIQVVYNIHFHGDVLWFLRLIHDRAVALGRQADWDDPDWRMLDMGGYGSGARWHLNIAVRDNNVELAEWCLAHGARPDAPSATAKSLSKRSLFEEALFRGETEIVRLFERYGTPTGATTVSGEQAFIAACLRHDESALRALAAEHPEYLPQPDAMFEAARRNDTAAMKLLFDLGVPADVEAADHTRALHIGGRADSLEAVELLVAKGAEIDPVETTWQGTPIGTATYFGCQRIVDFLSRYSRDVGTLTFNGKVDRIRELVEADPSLARTTADGASLLFWLPRDDEARAVAIARLLLAHGADPSVTDANGMTPGDRAERLAMFELVRVLHNRE
jgi:ankyrin repeat protein